MPQTGFEPAIPETKRLQTYALDRVAKGLGIPGIKHLPCKCTWHIKVGITFCHVLQIVQR
jgi:hypothetical protein